MVDEFVEAQFAQEVVTERELKRLRPDWPNTLIRDYITSKRGSLLITGEIEAIKIRLTALEGRVTYLKGTIVVTAVDVTAAGNTTIICTAAVTVRLASSPLDGDLVSIKAINGDKIIIDGNSNTIDGETSVTIRRNKASKIKAGLTMRFSTIEGWVLV